VSDPKRLVVLVTHGGEDPERATLPYVLASTAQSSGVDVVVCVEATGLMTIKRGCYEHIFAGGFPPLKQLVDGYLQGGGTIIACAPCTRARYMDAGELVEGVKVTDAPAVVEEIMKSSHVVCY
jgi:predicted peroxiredoxin